MAKIKEKIGDRLRRERERRKQTREAAAVELDVSPSRLRSWEMGFNEPLPSMLPMLEKWLRNGGGK